MKRYLRPVQARLHGSAPVAFALGHALQQAMRGWIVDRTDRQWKTLDRPDFRRSSDTLFVLGSGESINELTADDLETIARHDSLGLNFWTLHPLVPTAYVQEWINPDGSAIDANRLQVRGQIFEAREHELRDAQVLFRVPASRRTHGGRKVRPVDVRAQLPTFLRRVSVTSDLTLPPLSARDFGGTLRRADSFGLFREGRGANHVLSARGTVLWALVLAVRLGYRRVVLCGVDLNSTRYFYEVDDALIVEGAPIPPTAQTGTIHRTQDPAEPGPTMSEIIGEILPVAAKHGTTIEVGSGSSALAGLLPVHDWSIDTPSDNEARR